MKLNTHTIGQQWPQLEALLVHLVERIEELESAAAHKQKRIEVLTRKYNSWKNSRKNSRAGKCIIRGRRKGSERLRYDTAGRNVEATQRTNMDSKNFKRHRKLDRI